MKTNNFIVTQAMPASENAYIKNILQNIEIATYYDLNALATKEITSLKEYLLGRTLGVIEWEGHTLLIDPESLIQKVNLNCFECTKKNEAGCCCGSPCHYSQRNLKVFNAHKSQIIKELIAIEPKRYAELVNHELEKMSEEDLISGGNLTLELVDEEGAVSACNGRCGLLIREDGVSKCLTHKYALENNIPVYEISPLSCLMFPLEFLVLLTKEGEEVLLLTSVIEDDFARRYGRWGNYKDFEIPFTCVEPKSHNAQFKKEDYKALYKVNKDLFIHEFGQEVYEGICSICNNQKEV